MACPFVVLAAPETIEPGVALHENLLDDPHAFGL